MDKLVTFLQGSYAIFLLVVVGGTSAMSGLVLLMDGNILGLLMFAITYYSFKGIKSVAGTIKDDSVTSKQKQDKGTQEKIDAYLKERKELREGERKGSEHSEKWKSSDTVSPGSDFDNQIDHTYDKWQELGYQVKRRETSAYTHYGEHIFTRDQVAKIGSSNDYGCSYENHCWNCREHISSDSEEYCNACEMFVCSNCGECMCGYR